MNHNWLAHYYFSFFFYNRVTQSPKKKNSIQNITTMAKNRTKKSMEVHARLILYIYIYYYFDTITHGKQTNNRTKKTYFVTSPHFKLYIVSYVKSSSGGFSAPHSCCLSVHDKLGIDQKIHYHVYCCRYSYCC